jgi:hypothetical protein
MREILELAPNVPVEIALAYGAGKIIDTAGGSSRVMYTLTNGKIMFLDPDVAQRVNGLGVKPRQPFYLVKNSSGKKGEPTTWTAWLSPNTTTGEQPDGTFVVPSNGKPAAGGLQPPATVTAPSQAPQSLSGNGNKPAGSNGNGHTQPSVDAQHQALLAQANALVDVYAAALHYASLKYGNQVKSEDVRCLVTTVYISHCKNGGPA